MQEEEEKAAVAHLARRHGLLVLLRLTVISVVLCMCACVHGGVVRPEGRRELHGVVSSVRSRACPELSGYCRDETGSRR